VSNEKFLQNLAKQYVKETGEKYIKENDELNHDPTHTLDRKITTRRKPAQNWWKYAVTAASVVVLFVLGALLLRDTDMYNIRVTQPDATPQSTDVTPPSPTAPGAMWGDASADVEFAEVAEEDTVWFRSYAVAEPESWGDVMTGGGFHESGLAMPAPAPGGASMEQQVGLPGRDYSMEACPQDIEFNSREYGYSAFNKISIITPPGVSRSQVLDLATVFGWQVVHWEIHYDSLFAIIQVRADTEEGLLALCNYLMYYYPDIILSAFLE